MAKAPKKTAPKGRVVTAVGTASGHKDRSTANEIERAMTAAAVEANSKGITDPNKIREMMLKAREAAKRA